MSIDQNCRERQKTASSSSTNRAENEEFYPEYVFETTKPIFSWPPSRVFGAPTSVQRIKRRRPLQSGKIQTAEIHPKGSSISGRSKKGGPKIPFINGANTYLHHGPQTYIFMVHNLVFRWPTPYFSMGFAGAHGIGLQPQ